MNSRVLNITLLLMIPLIMAPGCKKGEEDPFFSFRTRTARLTGDWEVTKYTETVRDTVRQLIDGTMTETHPERNDRIHDLSIVMVFENEGEYTITSVHDYPANFNNEGEAAYTLTEEEKGTWQFTGGSGDSKENSQLLLLPAEVSSTRSDQGSNVTIINRQPPREGYVYDIVRLSADELKLSFMVTVSTALDEYVEQIDVELSKQD